VHGLYFADNVIFVQCEGCHIGSPFLVKFFLKNKA